MQYQPGTQGLLNHTDRAVSLLDLHLWALCKPRQTAQELLVTTCQAQTIETVLLQLAQLAYMLALMQAEQAMAHVIAVACVVLLRAARLQSLCQLRLPCPAILLHSLP